MKKTGVSGGSGSTTGAAARLRPSRRCGSKLMRLFTNPLENAVRHTPASRPTLALRGGDGELIPPIEPVTGAIAPWRAGTC